MYDAMFIVHALEQSPVYWNFVLYKSWCVVQYFSPPLFQMKVIALLQHDFQQFLTFSDDVGIKPV